VIAVAEPVFANAGRLALAGFLAGYTGLTRDAYALDLRQDTSWHQQHRYGAGRIVRRVALRAGITKKVGPRTLRHAFITAALDAGVPLRDVQEAASHADPRTTMRSGQDLTGPARHLRRRGVHRRSLPVEQPRNWLAPAEGAWPELAGHRTLDQGPIVIDQPRQ
jgi:Phage integrase family